MGARMKNPEIPEEGAAVVDHAESPVNIELGHPPEVRPRLIEQPDHTTNAGACPFEALTVVESWFVQGMIETDESDLQIEERIVYP